MSLFSSILSILKGGWTKRSWGKWRVLRDSPLGGYKIKELVIDPGESISLQYHDHRSEIWTILHGRGTLRVDDVLVGISAPDTVLIHRGAVHKATNTGEDLLLILETQLGEIRSERDIVRLPEDGAPLPNLNQGAEPH